MSVISNCDATTGWGLNSTAGTLSIDNTLEAEGTGCLKLDRIISKSRNKVSTLRFTLGSSTDFSNLMLTFKYRWEGTPLNELQFTLYNTSGFPTFSTGVDRNTTNGQWFTARIPIAGTWALANFFEIHNPGDQFADWTDGQDTTLYIDDVQLVALPPPTDIVSSCDSLAGWLLDTNNVGIGTIDSSIQTEGSGCIKYVRTVSKSRNFTQNLQLNLPTFTHPIGKILSFKFRWDTAVNTLGVRFLVGGSPAGSVALGNNVAPNVWHFVKILVSDANLSVGTNILQFNNSGDQFSGWSDGQTVTLYIDDIKLNDRPLELPAPSAVTISDCDDLTLWAIDSTDIDVPLIDSVIKTQGNGSISYTRVVNKLRAGTVAATDVITTSGVPPSNGEIITLDGVTYTFKLNLSTGPTVPNEIQIAGTGDDTLDNLIEAINCTDPLPDINSPEGIDYSIGTVANPTVSAGLRLIDSATLNYRTAGTVGNGKTASTTSATLFFSTPTFAGGGSGVKTLSSQMRYALPFSSLVGRELVFDYRWDTSVNQLSVRFVDINGHPVAGTQQVVSTRVSANAWHTARIPFMGCDLSKLHYLDILHPGDNSFTKLPPNYVPDTGWNNGDSPRLWIDNIHVEALKRRFLKQPSVVIQFDDGYQDTYTLALPIMQKYGHIATIGIATAYTGGNFVGNNLPCLSIAQITALATAGWEICSHTVNHHSMPTLSSADQDYELSQSKTVLEGWGFEINHFIYPYTRYSDHSANASGAHYSSATLGSPPYQVWRPKTGSIYGNINPQLLPRVPMGSKSTLQDFKNQINDAIANNTLPIIYFHSLTVAPGTVYVPPALFDQMMQWLSYAGIETLQTTDALQKYGYI